MRDAMKAVKRDGRLCQSEPIIEAIGADFIVEAERLRCRIKKGYWAICYGVMFFPINFGRITDASNQKFAGIKDYGGHEGNWERAYMEVFFEEEKQEAIEKFCELSETYGRVRESFEIAVNKELENMEEKWQLKISKMVRIRCLS